MKTFLMDDKREKRKYVLLEKEGLYKKISVIPSVLL